MCVYKKMFGYVGNSGERVPSTEMYHPFSVVVLPQRSKGVYMLYILGIAVVVLGIYAAFGYWDPLQLASTVPLYCR